jgi:hypothetical protein
MKRLIQLEDIADTILDTLLISKATGLKINAKMFHLDELDDGTWRIQYNGIMIPDMPKLKSLEFDGLEISKKPLENGKVIWHGLGITSKITKVTAVRGKHRYIHLDHDQAADTYRMLYHDGLIKDISAFKGLNFLRQD